MVADRVDVPALPGGLRRDRDVPVAQHDVAEHPGERLLLLHGAGERLDGAGAEALAPGDEAGELVDGRGGGLDTPVLTGQRHAVAAQVDLEVEPLLERPEHLVVVARELHGDAVGKFDRSLHHIDCDRVAPPSTCQCRWKTLCSASAPWLVVTR